MGRGLVRYLGRIGWPTLGLLPWLLAGCGAGVYESRLQNNTLPYFRYRQTQDENLADEWRGSGIRIRVPKQFGLIPAPLPPESDEEESEPVPEDDPRQPEFLSGELPGLVAAWTADVDLIEADYTAPAYIYVLSNYEMWRNPELGQEALEFNTTAAQALTDGLGLPFPPESQWVAVKYPRGEGYVPTKAYLTTTLKATVPLPVRLPARADDSADGSGGARRRRQDVPVDCLICLYETGDIRVTLIFIVPEQVATREKLDLESRTSRVALCLETLTVSKKKPSGPKTSRSAGF